MKPLQNTRLLIAVAVLASISSIAATVGLPIKQALSSNDTNDQRIALSTIRRQHTENVGLLIRLVGEKDVDNSWEGIRHLAIKLLGDMRSIDAIPVLVQRLTFLPTDIVVSEALPRECYYPCAMALVNIGAPSVGWMVGTIERGKDKETRDLAAWVLMEIEGSAVAAKHLQDLADKCHDGALKPHLLEGRDFIVNYKPILSPPGVEPKPVELVGPRADTQK